MVGADSRWVEDLCCKVPTKEAPNGAITSRVDVMLVSVEDFGSRGRFGPVCKQGTALDKGLVGQGPAEDEDMRLRPNVERDDGPEPSLKGSEPVLKPWR